jgi:hypothetical protein
MAASLPSCRPMERPNGRPLLNSVACSNLVLNPPPLFTLSNWCLQGPALTSAIESPVPPPPSDPYKRPSPCPTFTAPVPALLLPSSSSSTTSTDLLRHHRLAIVSWPPHRLLSPGECLAGFTVLHRTSPHPPSLLPATMHRPCQELPLLYLHRRRPVT